MYRKPHFPKKEHDFWIDYLGYGLMNLFLSKLEDLLLTIAHFGSSARYFAQTADFANIMKPESGRVESGRVESGNVKSSHVESGLVKLGQVI